MIDPYLHEDWDEFWGRVEQFAKEHHISTRHVEEEFVLDGELITCYNNNSKEY